MSALINITVFDNKNITSMDEPKCDVMHNEVHNEVHSDGNGGDMNCDLNVNDHLMNDQSNDNDNRQINDDAQNDNKSNNTIIDQIIDDWGMPIVDNDTIGTAKSVTSPSRDEQPSLYHLKWVNWKGNKTPIITQNENGPCPLLAIINVLIFKGRIQLPSMMEIITANQLMEYLGDCIISSVPKNIPEGAQLNYEQNFQDAMAILPKLPKGMDVNVKFSGTTEFEYTPECIVFDLLHIPLYHGWLLDPQDIEMQSAIGNCSYNQLVDKIINNKSSSRPEFVTEALIAEHFLEKSASQLTYHGLLELIDTLKEDELSVLFRNNHFITLHKHKNHLYQLVTDQGFLTETNVVWETLSNIEGDGEFVDGDFVLVPPKPALSPNVSSQQQIDQDYLVALSLQEEQKRVAESSKEWEKFKHESGMEDLTDEELARRLQDEEKRYATQRQQQEQQSAQQPQQLTQQENRSHAQYNSQNPNSPSPRRTTGGGNSGNGDSNSNANKSKSKNVSV